MTIIPQDPYGNPEQKNYKGVDPETVKEFHRRSDVDGSPFAQHHTIGTSRNQAAAGDHTHKLKSWNVAATAATTINSTTPVDLPGVTITIPVIATSDVFIVMATIDCQVETVGGICVGELVVNGVAQSAQIICNQATATERICVSQSYRVTNITPGDVIFKLRASRTGGVAVYTIFNTHTTLTVMRFPF